MATAKKRRRRSKKSSHALSSFLHRLYWILAIVSVLAAAGVIGYFSGYNNGLDENVYALQLERKRVSELHEQLKHKTVKTAKHEYDDQPAAIKEPPKGPKRAVIQTVKKPKLAIIIDDVSFKHDVRNIKALGLDLTMSFLPPSELHPNSAKLAAKELFYMVHIPMEAQNFKGEEPLTLYVTDSQEKITQRVEQIKELFPKVQYVNNHTGSKYTSDKAAMHRLMYALNGESIYFIDSRTTAKTVVPDVMKDYGMPYIARDVFLDHDPDVAAVKKQIKRAIAIAKKHGSAIVIGHPHKKTLQALRESKALFDDVELVQINHY
ncbi:MAG: divergent polysaccharide deacetylase family protein [Epsilonproteobacteria bacterium]|nr:MAG: divergent polysaccharide deacetylase family protein [Campylobacterota bacterium]